MWRLRCIATLDRQSFWAVFGQIWPFWPWTFVVYRLSRDQTLRQILAKSNDPRMSYSDFVIINLWPSPPSSWPKVDFHNFAGPLTPTVCQISTQSASANVRLSYNQFHGPFFRGKFGLPIFQELGKSTSSKFRERYTTIVGAPNAPVKFVTVALFRNQSALKSTGVENRGHRLSLFGPRVNEERNGRHVWVMLLALQHSAVAGCSVS